MSKMSKQHKTVFIISSLMGNVIGVNGIVQMLFTYHLVATALAIAACLVTCDVVLAITLLVFILTGRRDEQ